MIDLYSIFSIIQTKVYFSYSKYHWLWWLILVGYTEGVPGRSNTIYLFT